MIKKHPFFQPGEINLEGIISCPDNRCVGEVVLSHPHPLYGRGDMDNNVITAISKKLSENRFVALRFNLRGVGKSEGNYDNGRGETRDVESAVNLLKETEIAKVKIFFSDIPSEQW